MQKNIKYHKSIQIIQIQIIERTKTKQFSYNVFKYSTNQV